IPGTTSAPTMAEVDPPDSDLTRELFGRVYQELHAVARHCLRGERRDHTLLATALVHEAFLRLAAADAPAWQDSGHLLALASRAIRRVLVNHARSRRAQRRGGGKSADLLPALEAKGDAGFASIDVIELTEALDELERLDARQARIVELRFVGGLDNDAIARILGISLRSVEGEWRLSRAWLRRRLAREELP
ncbi:MAG: ECF-type sigma factor, partial [Planctomycetota bacterium]